MGDSFNCDLCDSSFTSKSRKKHLKSKQPKYFSSHIIYRFFIINPELLQIEDILKKKYSWTQQKNWILSY